MKKLYVAAICSVFAGGAVAADLKPSQLGSTCSAFHFVNNKSGTTTPGLLTAYIGGLTCQISPYKVTPNGTQHFLCTVPGTLTYAATNLAGDLVLSDCFGTPPKEEPCDPKTQTCPK